MSAYKEGMQSDQSGQKAKQSGLQEGAGEIADRASKVIDQTKQAVSDAYNKTATGLTDVYGQAMTYGKQNPGMLTLIAYMLTLGNTLPKIAYLTRADRFIVGSAVLVFLGVVKAVLTLVISQSPRANLIERVDRVGRWLYPVAVVVNFIVALVV